MHTYLLRAPCVKRQLKQRFVFVRGQHFVIRTGVFAAIVHAALNNAAFLAGNGRFNTSRRGGRQRCRDAKVFFSNLLLRKQKLYARLLGKNNEAGSVAVKP